MREKLWRMEINTQISAYVRGENRQLKDSLNIRHSLADLNLFKTGKKEFLEEAIFSHIYPFCMINCSLLTAWTLRKTSWAWMGLGCFLMLEYVYFLFNFPVEAWHFHRRALCTDKPYAQYIRDSYRAKFPHTEKAAIYAEVDRLEALKYADLLEKVDQKMQFQQKN